MRLDLQELQIFGKQLMICNLKLDLFNGHIKW
jgi:hypothetical protein